MRLLTSRPWSGILTCVVTLTTLCAQDPRAEDPRLPRADGGGWRLSHTYVERVGQQDDFAVLVVSRGVLLERGDTEIRARDAVILNDIDAERALTLGGPTTTPRRPAPEAAARRVFDEAELERRLRSFLAATGQAPPPRADVEAARTSGSLVSLNRSIYLEGDVSVFTGGVEMLRADSMYASATDDRVVLRGVELRLPNRDPVTGVARYVVLRGAELVRQGVRLTGRDVSITSSRAGEPHFEILAGEVEVIERGNEFEIRGAGNRLLVFGGSLSRLPDVHFFTSQSPPFPIKGLTGGYGSKEGVRAEVTVGGTWNDLGGSLHEMLTGDLAEEFRGEWRLGIGFNQDRGIPLEPELDYRGGDLYAGRIRGLILDDQGRDRGPVQFDLDGQRITTTSRHLVRSQNRVSLGEATRLDIELFSASDPAVFPEFHQVEWLQSELPETHVMLRHGRDNWLTTLSGRFDLDGVAYDDARRVAPRFLEQRPLGTFDVFSEPIVALPGGIPLLLTSSTSAGLLRWNYDRLSNPLVREDALRLDQEFEIAAPFDVGSVWVRPFGFGRATYYSDSPRDEDVTRWVAGAGVRAGFELQRTWRSADDAGAHGIRHTVNPEIGLVHRSRVSKAPALLYQFDEVDSIDEDVTLRVGVLNRILTSHSRGERPALRNETIWLDLAQNFKPIADRDNGGEVLGLGEYELVLRPGFDWPLPNLKLFVEGEHDWKLHDERTFNVGTQFGKVAGVDWTVEYREDRTRKGILIAGGSAEVWHRWLLSGGSGYDLEGDDVLWYQTVLARRDLDWSVFLGVTYDNLNAETSFFLRFEPTLGGFVQGRSRDVLRNHQTFGPAALGY